MSKISRDKDVKIESLKNADSSVQQAINAVTTQFETYLRSLPQLQSEDSRKIITSLGKQSRSATNLVHMYKLYANDQNYTATYLTENYPEVKFEKKQIGKMDAYMSLLMEITSGYLLSD